MKRTPAQSFIPDGKTKIPAELIVDKMGSSVKVSFEITMTAFLLGLKEKLGDKKIK
ncbi:MAG: hypothetical protein NUV69_00645 [Candidatus Curtissbacteria bacterium]|nr:hypothetical protein [Candidatus Curtissbacteria bacterium]